MYTILATLSASAQAMPLCAPFAGEDWQTRDACLRLFGTYPQQCEISSRLKAACAACGECYGDALENYHYGLVDRSKNLAPWTQKLARIDDSYSRDSVFKHSQTFFPEPDHPSSCPICRTQDRYLADPSQTFMHNDRLWTCSKLQASVWDVPEFGSESEARWCRMHQYVAEAHCTCLGPYIPPLDTEVHYPNPACNLCDSQQQLNHVPEFHAHTMVDVGRWGTHNCLALSNAAARGLFAVSSCIEVQSLVGSTCCSLPSI